jgi:hypothetical protein
MIVACIAGMLPREPVLSGGCTETIAAVLSDPSLGKYGSSAGSQELAYAEQAVAAGQVRNS